MLFCACILSSMSITCMVVTHVREWTQQECGGVQWCNHERMQAQCKVCAPRARLCFFLLQISVSCLLIDWRRVFAKTGLQRLVDLLTLAAAQGLKDFLFPE